MILLQVLLISFAFFMIYVVRIHFQKRSIRAFEYAFWILTWLGFAFFVLRPSTILGIAQSLNIARVFDLLVIIALMFLTLLTFYNRILYHQLVRKIEEIIRLRAQESVSGKLKEK